MKNKPKRKREKIVCPKAGTATSSPAIKTASQSNMNIVNVMLWMQRSVYQSRQEMIKYTNEKKEVS